MVVEKSRSRGKQAIKCLLRNLILQELELEGENRNLDYLKSIIIQMPGDVGEFITIGNFYRKMGLNPKDPYTYQLSLLLKKYFELHPEREVRINLLKKT